MVTSQNDKPHVAETQDGLVPTIERFQSVKRRQRDAESVGRKLAKEADTLEKAIADQVETAGGMLSAGKYVLGFDEQEGSKYPPYKQICEEIVLEFGLPGDTLTRKLAALPKRRKLVIA